MALDRQSIERKDFPVGRRGYDPEAVDAHLSALADEVAEFKREARRRSDTLASAASEQVRAIVEAAEASAAQIQREAEEEAAQIREEANNEARTARERASEQEREHVGKVSELTNAMLARVDSMEQEMNSLIESLRAGAGRLNTDLEQLMGDLAGVSGAVESRPRFEPEASGAPDVHPEAGMPETAGGEAQEFHEVVGDAGAGAAAETAEASGAMGETAPAMGAGESGPADGENDDAEGARLIALNMALNGTPRDETERYLSENFRLADAGGLLDEVYASVEG